MYSGAFEIFITKLQIICYVSLCLFFPHLLFAIGKFIRPGLFNFESFYFNGYFIFYFHLLSWINIYIGEFLLSEIIKSVTTEYTRYIPTLEQTTLQIKLIFIISVLTIILPILIYNFINKYNNYYIKGRIIIIYGLIFLLTLILPPDILSIAIAITIVVGTLEGIYLIIIWIQNLCKLIYVNDIPSAILL